MNARRTYKVKKLLMELDATARQAARIAKVYYPNIRDQTSSNIQLESLPDDLYYLAGHIKTKLSRATS